MAKIKRFASNGYVTNEDSNSGMKEAYDYDRAMRMAEVDSKSDYSPKPEITTFNEKTGVKGDSGSRKGDSGNRVVSKKELADSGLSLRDFLNKERGLTRRGEPAAKPAPKADTAPKQSQAEKDYAEAEAKAKTPEAKAERDKQIKGQAAENITGDFIPMGRLAKAAGAAGTALAKFGGPKGLTMAERQALPAPAPRLTGPSKADLVSRDRAARAAGRQEEMLKENASRYGLDPKSAGYEGVSKAVRKELGDGKFSLGMKRGGAVKSSASSRADGIAQRGRTKGRMY